MQQRRRGVAPVQAEPAVVLLDVAHPQLGALEVECLEDAGAGHHPDADPVGHRRGGRHVLLALHVVAAADRPLPGHRAGVAIDAPQLELAVGRVHGDVEEDGVVPDDWRGAAAARHGELPGDVLGLGPGGGQAALAADAIQLWSAPLRPVIGEKRHRGE